MTTSQLSPAWRDFAAYVESAANADSPVIPVDPDQPSPDLLRAFQIVTRALWGS